MRPMRTLIALVALAALILTSCGATLAVRGTAPTQLNDGTCTAPILSLAATLQMVHAQVLGRGLEDSVLVMPGAAFAFSWAVPAGDYPVRVWATIAARPDLVGGDTTATIEALARPDRVRLQ